jgi:hypothetical protein
MSRKIPLPSLTKQVEEIPQIKELTTEISETDSLIKELEQEPGFIYPTVVGIPVINKSEDNTKIHISGKYHAEVLSGRTYLAR